MSGTTGSFFGTALAGGVTADPSPTTTVNTGASGATLSPGETFTASVAVPGFPLPVSATLTYQGLVTVAQQGGGTTSGFYATATLPVIGQQTFLFTPGNPAAGATPTFTPGDFTVCFAAGTLVATARGEVAVEDLRVGDLVVTVGGDAALQPVVWLGHTRMNIARHPNPAAAAPILITAGALADGVPHRDLRVSPEHAMFLDGCLVPAKHLVNGASIVQEVWCPEVTYWHVELATHSVLVAEGALSESYFDDGNRTFFDNHGVTALVKDFASARQNCRYAEAACHPLLQDGPLLERIRARIEARAAAAIAPHQDDRRSA